MQEQYSVLFPAQFSYDVDLCRDMRCRQVATGLCQGTLPFDGTTCGNHKVGYALDTNTDTY